MARNIEILLKELDKEAEEEFYEEIGETINDKFTDSGSSTKTRKRVIIFRGLTSPQLKKVKKIATKILSKPKFKTFTGSL